MNAAISEISNDSPWIAYSTPNPGAATRLFCFPYAGGSASIYRQWNGSPLDSVEVCPIQTPGRENRLTEKPFSRMRSLSTAVADVIPQDKPFAFFGHSVGALLAFEVARELRRREGDVPFHLFASAAPAPHLCPNRPPRFNLQREQLLVELRKLNGTPHEVLESSELFDLILPLIRADFALLDTYDYRGEEPFHFPVTAMAGDSDLEVDSLETLQWHIHTHDNFRHYRLSGDHFFLHEFSAELRSLIANEIERTAPVRQKTEQGRARTEAVKS